MSKFRVKRAEVEAVTFDELVAIGREQNPGRAEMPWSFQFADKPITHEHDDCYLFPTASGVTGRFNRGDMLVVGMTGELFTASPEEFADRYEAI